jgi:hypothetical protein
MLVCVAYLALLSLIVAAQVALGGTRRKRPAAAITTQAMATSTRAQAPLTAEPVSLAWRRADTPDWIWGAAAEPLAYGASSVSVGFVSVDLSLARLEPIAEAEWSAEATADDLWAAYLAKDARELDDARKRPSAADAAPLAGWPDETRVMERRLPDEAPVWRDLVQPLASLEGPGAGWFV